jgi:hypothetical protein
MNSHTCRLSPGRDRVQMACQFHGTCHAPGSGEVAVPDPAAGYGGDSAAAIGTGIADALSDGLSVSVTAGPAALPPLHALAPPVTATIDLHGEPFFTSGARTMARALPERCGAESTDPCSRRRPVKAGDPRQGFTAGQRGGRWTRPPGLPLLRARRGARLARAKGGGSWGRPKFGPGPFPPLSAEAVRCSGRCPAKWITS